MVDMSPEAVTRRLRLMDELWELSVALMDARKVPQGGRDVGLLAKELVRLIEFVPRTKAELSDWYEQARLLQAGDLLKGAPHFVWHYLADADIRMKDDVYAEMQNRRIKTVLDYLNKGVMPSDEDVDENEVVAG